MDIDVFEEEEESDEEERPLYNPKNLPLGFDGKPIPYWLYKVHNSHRKKFTIADTFIIAPWSQL